MTVLGAQSQTALAVRKQKFVDDLEIELIVDSSDDRTAERALAGVARMADSRFRANLDQAPSVLELPAAVRVYDTPS